MRSRRILVTRRSRGSVAGPGAGIRSCFLTGSGRFRIMATSRWLGERRASATCP